MSYRTIDFDSEGFEEHFPVALQQFFNDDPAEMEHKFLVVIVSVPVQTISFDFIGGARTERGAFLLALAMHHRNGNPVPSGSIVSVYQGCTDASGNWTGEVRMLSVGECVYRPDAKNEGPGKQAEPSGGRYRTRNEQHLRA